jgi:hypothetical protein
MLSAKDTILKEFALFRGNGGGIENWFSEKMPDRVAEALLNSERSPISCEELNQFLILSHEAGVSRGFFNHYFCTSSYDGQNGPYDPTGLPFFEARFLSANRLLSLSHLKWGLYRLYVDSLLKCGNIRQGFRLFRSKSEEAIQAIVQGLAFDASAMKQRGKFLPLEPIAKDDRYLIAEIACKTYAPRDTTTPDLAKFLMNKHKVLSTNTTTRITFRDLIGDEDPKASYTKQLTFALDDLLDTAVVDESDLKEKISVATNKFQSARSKALRNTELYLSMISDMDIYVATSMRQRLDFRKMADFCDSIFSDTKVADLNLRHFDPTLSAAIGHEDKGLIECLMVKCAKVLVYTAGSGDSFGKDVEAAMALSLGKPVIFFCDGDTRANFYREIHPLARLINFETGVAGGAIVTDNLLDVPELLSRIFHNRMEYELEKKSDSYFVLKEKLTDSTIRLQTDDTLLRETFWNYYNHESGLSD